MKIDKDSMIDSKGAARTQSLFLETSYSEQPAGRPIKEAILSAKFKDGLYDN